jgi:hypothetical protein
MLGSPGAYQRLKYKKRNRKKRKTRKRGEGGGRILANEVNLKSILIKA